MGGLRSASGFLFAGDAGQSLLAVLARLLADGGGELGEEAADVADLFGADGASGHVG